MGKWTRIFEISDKSQSTFKSKIAVFSRQVPIPSTFSSSTSYRYAKKTRYWKVTAGEHDKTKQDASEITVDVEKIITVRKMS